MGEKDVLRMRRWMHIWSVMQEIFAKYQVEISSNNSKYNMPGTQEDIQVCK